MSNTTKAVIPCGGFGTRMLPATKSLPKELLPVIDTPILHYIVEEIVDSGIIDLLIIINKQKESIRHYFSADNALYDSLLQKGKTEEVAQLRRVHDRCEISFAYQEVARGSGDALLLAESFVGDDSFALALGDDLIVNSVPVVSQLMDAYRDLQSNILGVQTVLTDDIVLYGVPDVVEQRGRTYRCSRIVEKPALHEIPSRLAALGRYVLTSEVFDSIRNSSIERGELQLTTAINILATNNKVWAYDFEGIRFDMGDRLGTLKAQMHFGKQRFGQDFVDYVESLCSSKI